MSQTPILDWWKKRAEEYERRIADYAQVIAELRRRRSSQTDSMMLEIDARIAINERCKSGMQMGLENAKDEVERLESKSRD